MKSAFFYLLVKPKRNKTRAKLHSITEETEVAATFLCQTVCALWLTIRIFVTFMRTPDRNFVHITELNWVSQRLLPRIIIYIGTWESKHAMLSYLPKWMYAWRVFFSMRSTCVDVRARADVFCKFISFSLRVAHTFHHSFPFWNGAGAMHFLVSPCSFTNDERRSHCIFDSIAFLSRFIHVYCWTAAHTSSRQTNKK